MVTEIDLRNFSPHELQDRIYDVLDEIEADTDVFVIADRAIDAHLIQYQIEGLDFPESRPWGRVRSPHT